MRLWLLLVVGLVGSGTSFAALVPTTKDPKPEAIHLFTIAVDSRKESMQDREFVYQFKCPFVVTGTTKKAAKDKVVLAVQKGLDAIRDLCTIEKKKPISDVSTEVSRLYATHLRQAKLTMNDAVGVAIALNIIRKDDTAFYNPAREKNNNLALLLNTVVKAMK